MNIKQLDSYSLLITSKYFKTEQDFINIMCVGKKFQETTEKFRFNPIPITSLKLFPKIQTQYLYTQDDIIIDGINNYEIWYEVDYDQYFLKYKQDNIKCHHIVYYDENRLKYGDDIPTEVTSLGNGCFGDILASLFDGGIENVETVIIPNNVTSIKNHCFDSCIDLKSCILSTKLRTISRNCFSNCTSLTTINIPTTIQVLKQYGYEQCWKLKTITIPNSVYSIGNYCFHYCSSLQSITIPTSISILQSTFQNCSALSKVILPTSLISIEYHCFENCENLKTIKLPTSLKNIGKECFKNCGIESIELPNSIQSIGINCFFKRNSLINLNLKSHTNKFTFKVSYNDSILYKKHGITCTNIIFTNEDFIQLINEILFQNLNTDTLIIPTNVVEIDNNSFNSNNHLESITIPTSITSIGNNCFNRCNFLTSLSIPNTIKSIGIDCYLKCVNLKQLSLPLNENNEYPFKVSYGDYLILKKFNIDCKNVLLNEKKFGLTIPKDIPIIIHDCFKINEKTSIPNNIISMKSNYLSVYITKITIPTSVTYLCDDCFKNYVNLKSITIPTTVKYIGKHIIDGCTSLSNIKYDGNWNNIVVSYNDYLRYNRNGLIFQSIEYTKHDKKKYGDIIQPIVKSLHKSFYNRSNDIFNIPTHITSLDNKMFSVYKGNLSNLKSIIIPVSIKTIPKNCFAECYLLTKVHLPSTLKNIKKKSFSNCISLQSVTIPLSIITIEKYSFENCYSLTSITIPTTLSILKESCFKNCYQLKDILNVPDYLF